MSEWNVVLIIIELVGFALLVGKPLLTLNNTITKLNVELSHINGRMDKQQKDLENQKEHASESHRRLWEHENEQDTLLANHEIRIVRLENNN